MQSDYFSLFGLEKTFTQDNLTIRTRYYRLQQTAHPDKFANAPIAEQRAALMQASIINEAYQVLCSPLRRAMYLLKLHGVEVQLETDTAMEPDFLMEQMVLRERLCEGEIDALKIEIASKLEAYENKLTTLLDQTTAQSLMQARNVVRQMLFFVRLEEEVE